MIDFRPITEQAAKNSAAAELGVPPSECEFIYVHNHSGNFVKAFHDKKGYSSLIKYG